MGPTDATVEKRSSSVLPPDVSDAEPEVWDCAGASTRCEAAKSESLLVGGGAMRVGKEMNLNWSMSTSRISEHLAALTQKSLQNSSTGMRPTTVLPAAPIVWSAKLFFVADEEEDEEEGEAEEGGDDEGAVVEADAVVVDDEADREEGANVADVAGVVAGVADGCSFA